MAACCGLVSGTISGSSSGSSVRTQCPDSVVPSNAVPPPGRCDGTIPASGRPIGWVPTREELQLLDIEVKYGSQIFFATSANIFCQDCEDIHELLSTPSSFWREEVEEMRAYFSQQVTGLIMMRLSHVPDEHPQVGESLPQEMWHQLHQLERRISLFEDDVESEE